MPSDFLDFPDFLKIPGKGKSVRGVSKIKLFEAHSRRGNVPKPGGLLQNEPPGIRTIFYISIFLTIFHLKMVGASEAPQPPSTRARGQDDGSLHKRLQISPKNPPR